MGHFPGAGDFQGKVLRESRAKHLMVPMLLIRLGSLRIQWYHRRLLDLSSRRIPGSRIIRDLMITSVQESFQRLHRTSRRLRRKKATESEHDSQAAEEPMESDVMDAEGSLYQKPQEVCITEDTESIDLGWFEHTKLLLNVCYKWAFAAGIHWVRVHR